MEFGTTWNENLFGKNGNGTSSISKYVEQNGTSSKIWEMERNVTSSKKKCNGVHHWLMLPGISKPHEIPVHSLAFFDFDEKLLSDQIC